MVAAQLFRLTCHPMWVNPWKTTVSEATICTQQTMPTGQEILCLNREVSEWETKLEVHKEGWDTNNMRVSQEEPTEGDVTCKTSVVFAQVMLLWLGIRWWYELRLG